MRAAGVACEGICSICVLCVCVYVIYRVSVSLIEHYSRRSMARIKLKSSSILIIGIFTGEEESNG